MLPLEIMGGEFIVTSYEVPVTGQKFGEPANLRSDRNTSPGNWYPVTGNEEATDFVTTIN